VGNGLGANLALEVAATHPEFAGVVLDEPIASPTDAIFGDPRARIVPAHVLVSDRWDSMKSAMDLRIPSLWFRSQSSTNGQQPSWGPEIFEHVTSPKRIIELTGGDEQEKEYTEALSLWLKDLAEKQ
jgi:pimeloyl-ACP methyl ester carboxylesterase